LTELCMFVKLSQITFQHAVSWQKDCRIFNVTTEQFV
jgi:hypothetical protein